MEFDFCASGSVTRLSRCPRWYHTLLGFTGGKLGGVNVLEKKKNDLAEHSLPKTREVKFASGVTFCYLGSLEVANTNQNPL